jgi:LytR cell envelope-related transcriptional attenuator/LytR_cpsA_psr family
VRWRLGGDECRRAAWWGARIVVLAVSLGFLVNLVTTRVLSPAAPVIAAGVGNGAAPEPAADLSHTTALLGTSVGGGGPALVWVALLSLDEAGDSGSIIYVPAHTAAEVPGRGLRSLADAYASGGLALLLVSTENLLDVDIDRYLQVSNRGAATLLGSVGPLSIDVPADVRVAAGPGKARPVFTAGLQEVPGDYLARLLYVVGMDGGETDLGMRHLAFWNALMARFGSNPAALKAAMVDASGALADSNSTPAHNADLLATMASIDDADMTLGVLPVRDVGAAGTTMFEVDTSAAEAVLGGLVSRSSPEQEGHRVQVLNGNGAPGIGQTVGQMLVDGGFDVALSGNAQTLDYRVTRIVTYDPTPEGLADAARVRELLGIGEIQISRQTQGIVDLTVVVGRDFLRAN